MPKNILKELKQDPSWVHITGIGGITTGQLAIAFAKEGFHVTGSDVEIYEPMKSHLESYKSIKIYKGYSFSNLIDKDRYGDREKIPSMVVVNGGLSLKNKEYLFAKKQGITVQNYAQVLEKKCVVDDASIVVAGSFGKTTVTSLLVHIFNELGVSISYMFGGIMKDIDNAVKFKDATTRFSVIEGDEYFSARFDKVSKFFHYQPKYLVLTGYAYDHADFFSTPAEYFENFQNLVEQIPADGMIVYNGKYKELEELASRANCKTIAYNYEPNKSKFKSNLIGDFNQENILAAATLVNALKLPGISQDQIEKAVQSYPGLYRRLEIKHNSDSLVMIDDFGSTPGKAQKALETVRKEYKDANIIAVFEPNLGSRQAAILQDFAQTFDEANTLILNEFTHTTMSSALSQQDFYDYLVDKHASIKTVSSKQDSIYNIIESSLNESKLNIVLFLSSHGVEGQILQFKKSFNN